jgi:hypothetical protein
MTFSTEHPEAWRNEVAKDLNEVLARVQWTLETSGADEPGAEEAVKCDMDFAQAAIRMVERVANFEEICRATSQF